VAVKKKYGQKLSWGDLMVLTGNGPGVHGLQDIRFAGGRSDDWEPDLVYWGSTSFSPATDDKSGVLDKARWAPLKWGLIYGQSRGPNGNADPSRRPEDIRETFGNMAMNDEETVVRSS